MVAQAMAVPRLQATLAHMTTGAGPSLLDPCAVAKFDREQFERDGFWVWESVLLPGAAAELRAACQRVQLLNDRWISADWDSLDWAALRAMSTPQPEPSGAVVDMMNAPGWTAADLRDGMGQTHALPMRAASFAKLGYRAPQWDHPRVPVLQGYPPEMFPAGYDSFLMRTMLHPEMLSIHRSMLGPVVRFDHNTLLNRKGGYGGTPWHAHPHHEDGLGRTTRVPALGQVRSLVYPDGFSAGQDGGLRVVPGGHLYRQARLEPRSAEPPSEWATDDALFEAEWLAGKTHPITGEPLQVVELELAPGSIVSCLSHCPHAVSPKSKDRPTRYCTLLCYGKPDPAGVLPRSSERETWSLPAEFERRACEGGIQGVDAGPSNFFTRY